MKGRALAVIVVVVLILVAGVGFLSVVNSVGAPAAQAAASPSATRTSPTAVPTQAPPTQVRWAIDRGPDAARPYLLELLYDNVATGFRIIDTSGQVSLRFPISGSGVFGSDSCVGRAERADKAVRFTYLLIDATTYEKFSADAATYRVEADSVAQQVVTLPLTDSGCRSSASASLPPIPTAVGFTLPSICAYAGSPVVGTGGSQWKFDCGSGANRDARGTLAPALTAQGWISCGVGLGNGTWIKDDLRLIASEGSGAASPDGLPMLTQPTRGIGTACG